MVKKGWPPGYWQVTIRVKGKLRKFWAQILKKGTKFTLYRRVNREGEDFGYFRKKDQAFVDKQELISNSLIVSERHAVMDKHYGTMRLAKKQDYIDFGLKFPGKGK